MIGRKHVEGFTITLLTIVFFLLLGNAFVSELGLTNDQVFAELATVRKVTILGALTVFGGVSAALAVALVRMVSKLLDRAASKDERNR